METPAKVIADYAADVIRCLEAIAWQCFPPTDQISPLAAIAIYGGRFLGAAATAGYNAGVSPEKAVAMMIAMETSAFERSTSRVRLLASREKRQQNFLRQMMFRSGYLPLHKSLSESEIDAFTKQFLPALRQLYSADSTN